MRMCLFCASANEIQGNHRISTKKSPLLVKIICAIKYGIGKNARTIFAKCSVPGKFNSLYEKIRVATPLLFLKKALKFAIITVIHKITIFFRPFSESNTTY